MVVYANHTNHMFSFAFVIYDQHIIVEGMEFEEMPIIEWRMFQHMIMPSGFFHFTLLRKLANSFAH